ncbi:Type I restriction modification DNA specificity domain protein [Clostridium perfringens]|uniref:restriction endonuclease subunit S n=1 Tax=Clostridium perfringens TaxID=1502 RepID=UPI00244153C4|nr:restriction endonuclease subunit S [Clostridium perfringens]MDG6889418.1 Type I restriction modification DNA specificity domain protein [Clostridium perfringens]
MENNDILKGQLGSYVDFLGGDSCITKNFIYYNMPMDEKQSIPVYSSSTKEQTFMGMINKLATNRGKNIKVFEGEAILVARNGQAGKMRYIPKGHEFTINDHAYVMKVKKQYRDRINLTWFMFKFQRLFYEIVIAKDANGNFNKTYANEQEIIIPSIKTQELELEKIKKLCYIKVS